MTLLLFGGCVLFTIDGDGDTGPEDTAVPLIEVSFTVTLPEGVTGEVSVYLSERSYLGEEYDDVLFGSCEAGAAECTIVVPDICEKAIGWCGYDVFVESETAIFIQKAVEVSADGAVPDAVSWVTGGCEDEGWTPESLTCNAWTHGEWGLAPNGMFYCDTCGGTGYDSEIVTDNSPDIDDDGEDDINLRIEELGGGTDFVLAGSVGHDVRDGWDGNVTV